MYWDHQSMPLENIDRIEVVRLHRGSLERWISLLRPPAEKVAQRLRVHLASNGTRDAIQHQCLKRHKVGLGKRGPAKSSSLAFSFGAHKAADFGERDPESIGSDPELPGLDVASASAFGQRVISVSTASSSFSSSAAMCRSRSHSSLA